MPRSQDKTTIHLKALYNPLDKLADEVWADIRSHHGPLDNELQSNKIAEALKSVSTLADIQRDLAIALAEDLKTTQKKLMQLIHKFSTCPVCGVGDAVLHESNCWIKNLAPGHWRIRNDHRPRITDKSIQLVVSQVPEVAESH